MQVDEWNLGHPQWHAVERSAKCAFAYPRSGRCSRSGVHKGAAVSVKYFFADSQDLVDPNFNFTIEDWGRERIRQRLEAYAHEVFKTPAYDGLLISKGIVSGVGGGSRFSLAQRHR